MGSSLAIGQRFGCLTIIGAAGVDDRGRSHWIVRCACGNERVRRSDALNRSGARCSHQLRSAEVKRPRERSAEARTPEYGVWCGMRNRCRNPKNKDFPRYGGRGIKVCERWESFKNFLADMGQVPAPGLTIDRINNDGNYEPGNCRWATRLQQVLNR